MKKEEGIRSSSLLLADKTFTVVRSSKEKHGWQIIIITTIGASIPDTRRVFDPLGDGDEIISLPAGI